MQQPRLNGSASIVDEDGAMSQQLRDLINQLTDLIPLTGSGSPEGVVSAAQFSTYLDKNGAAGSIEYRKMLTNISDNKLRGWKAV